jgi:hypothetical protein
MQGKSQLELDKQYSHFALQVEKDFLRVFGFSTGKKIKILLENMTDELSKKYFQNLVDKFSIWNKLFGVSIYFKNQYGIITKIGKIFSLTLEANNLYSQIRYENLNTIPNEFDKIKFKLNTRKNKLISVELKLSRI